MAPLTDEMIKAGESFTEALDNSGLDVKASLWLFEHDVWTLVLGISEVNSQGPRKVYKKVRSLLLRDQQLYAQLDLRNVSVRSPDQGLIALLRRILKTSPPNAMKRLRFADNYVNDFHVEDALINRLV